MVSEPSFGVFETKIVENVKPPSVESLIFIFVDPAKASEPFTVHVIVCAVPWDQLKFSVFWDVIAN